MIFTVSVSSSGLFVMKAVIRTSFVIQLITYIFEGKVIVMSCMLVPCSHLNSYPKVVRHGAGII